MPNVIIPCPYAVSPYGVADAGVDAAYKSILNVAAANENMQEKFPSNLLLAQAEVYPPVTFETYPDTNPDGVHLDTARSMQSNLADSVARALQKSANVVVLGGDHTIAIGTGAGLSRHIDLSKVGLIYVDAHADCHTPVTSLSKSITGYPVAVNCGIGPKALTSRFKSHLQHVAYVGVRDVDRGELENIDFVNLQVYSNLLVEEKGIVEVTKRILHKFAHLEYLWLSIDLDALDPVYFRRGETDVPVTGGLTPRELLTLTRMVAETNRLKITEFVQLNDVGESTSLSVLVSRLSELALGLGGYRYGVGHEPLAAPVVKPLQRTYDLTK